MKYLLLYNSRWGRVLAHVLFWIVHLALSAVIWYFRSIELTILIVLVDLPFKMLNVYTILYWAFPRFLAKGKYVSFALAFIAIIVVLDVVQLSFYRIFLPHWSGDGNIRPEIMHLILTVYICLMALLFKVLKFWNRREQALQAARASGMEAELNFLKAQINPHFLFNTLNNLYTLCIQRKSAVAAKVVERLAELFRYMSYDSNQKYVDLPSEIAHLQNYIELERVRYGQRLHLEFSLVGDPSNHRIAPLIILPFVENCFKHGANQTTGEAHISIQLEVLDHALYARFENTVAAQGSAETDGIGLANVRRRLALLYVDKHTLTISPGNPFLVYLKMHLS